MIFKKIFIFKFYEETIEKVLMLNGKKTLKLFTKLTPQLKLKVYDPSSKFCF